MATETGKDGAATPHAAPRRRSRRGRWLLAAGAVVVAAGAATAFAYDQANALPPTIVGAQPMGEIACGESWSQEPAVLEHFPGGATVAATVRGGWFSRSDDGTERGNPVSQWIGFEAIGWRGMVDGPAMSATLAQIIAVHDGTVVGVEPSYTTGGEFTAWAGIGGRCFESAADAHDGDVTYHLVLRVEEGTGDGRLAATYVDPSGPLTVDVSGLEEWVEWQPAE